MNFEAKEYNSNTAEWVFICFKISPGQALRLTLGCCSLRSSTGSNVSSGATNSLLKFYRRGTRLPAVSHSRMPIIDFDINDEE